jgi:hypothetical protein
MFCFVLKRLSHSEDRTERCVDENGAVQLGRGRGHVDGLHLLEAAERMALGNKLRNRTLKKT